MNINHNCGNNRNEKQMNAITKATAVAVLVTLGLVLTTAASGAEEEHPRLLATPELLAAVRVEIRKPGTHHQQVYETMKSRRRIVSRQHGPVEGILRLRQTTLQG